MDGSITAVSRSATHSLRKDNHAGIRLLAGIGVEGDVHAGKTVKHRSRLRRNAEQPNLRQVHLIAAELHDELAEIGMPVAPGEMGENVTTRGLDLLSLPAGTRLRLGDEAVVEVTGLRNPCVQLERIHPGLMATLRPLDAEGNVVRRAGVMAVVVAGGVVRPGDRIMVVLPVEPHRGLTPV